jgi:adenine-specific DNA-methyltransferase
MPPRKKEPAGPVPVEAFKHDDKRVNNPTADSGELMSADVAQPKQLRYPRNPDLDPQLVWAGKDKQDGDDLVVDAPPIYIQEKIAPQVIIENLRKVVEKPELTLFDDFDGLEGYEAVEYYKHEANWSNRMILGDSLQVMASLAEKENLRGKVQMVYLDPPYGIDFKSNWQLLTGSTNVSDGKAEHVTREVEQIKAFRDTWSDGVNSYLSYLRDRLVVARDLLTESGSVFVQIGDQNVHRVRAVLDEVFGDSNFVSLITVKKTSTGTGTFLAGVADYILWSAKNIETLKYRPLFKTKAVGGDGADAYRYLELQDGTRRPATQLERLNPAQAPDKSRFFRPSPLTSDSTGREKGEGAASWFAVEFDGQKFRPTMKVRWKTNEQGMERLRAANRLVATGKTLNYVRFLDDFPAFPINNLWDDTQSGSGMDKIYVVQTNRKVLERCMLMSTDPGDLVIDPTCGSGTTAFVAEEWGRRWITTDTSRVALALARQRIMGAKFPFYALADQSSMHKGFVYESVPHIKLETITRNPDIKPGMSRTEIDTTIKRHSEFELLYDRPEEDRRKVRVSGPFTVESLSPHSTVTPARSSSAETGTEDDGSAFEKSIVDNLLKAGVQNGRKAEKLRFESLVSYAGEYIQAEGIQRETEQRIAVAIGPRYGTVDPEFIRKAAREATRGLGFDLLLVCAFSFDPQAGNAMEEFSIGRVRVLLVRMNSDLAMGDVLLKKTGSGNLFTVFGEPDVAVTRQGDDVVVEIKGVDVYNPTTGEIRSSGTGEIALWMIDTDYDGESFFVRHSYFTGGNDPYKRLKVALKADIDSVAWETLYQTKSRPFPRPEKGKIAVKVINHYGDEVLQVYEV